MMFEKMKAKVKEVATTVKVKADEIKINVEDKTRAFSVEQKIREFVQKGYHRAEFLYSYELREIKNTREKYNELTEQQKQFVKNIDKLEEIEAIAKETLAVNEVDELISSLGYYGWTDEERVEKIKEAREKYNELSEKQKQFVKKLELLEEREAKFEYLKEKIEAKIKNLKEKIEDDEEIEVDEELEDDEELSEYMIEEKARQGKIEEMMKEIKKVGYDRFYYDILPNYHFGKVDQELEEDLFYSEYSAFWDCYFEDEEFWGAETFDIFDNLYEVKPVLMTYCLEFGFENSILVKSIKKFIVERTNKARKITANFIVKIFNRAVCYGMNPATETCSNKNFQDYMDAIEDILMNPSIWTLSQYDFKVLMDNTEKERNLFNKFETYSDKPMTKSKNAVIFIVKNYVDEEKVGRVDSNGDVFVPEGYIDEKKIGRVDSNGDVYVLEGYIDEKKVGRVDSDGNVYALEGYVDEEKIGRVEGPGKKTAAAALLLLYRLFFEVK